MLFESNSDRFKTLSRKDPEFASYLLGSFSSALRAIPVQSLNVGTQSEVVTFEILPVGQIKSPSKWALMVELSRASSLILSLAPMLSVLILFLVSGVQINLVVALSSLLGVLCFHIGINLFNDFNDHMKGQDRLRGEVRTHALQKGWVRAVSVKRVAWGLFFVAGLFGLPAIYLQFSHYVFVAGTALLLGLAFAFQTFRLKYHGWAEVMAFLLTGPLLTMGYSWAISGTFSPNIVLLGLMFGSLTLAYYHAKNFENIMPDSQAGIRTWATRAGFDASKNFFYLTSALILATSSVCFLTREMHGLFRLVLVVQVLALGWTIVKVREVVSPLASGLRGLRQRFLLLAWLSVVSMVIFWFFHWFGV